MSAESADEQYFVNSFSKIISVLGPTENNLLYHLLPLASASPLVMRGLVGWSAAHLAVLGEPFSSIARTSRIYIEQQLHSYERSNIDNREREEAMMAMLMLGGAEVCAGDVKGWNERLPIMRKMLISATDSEAQLTREWKGMAFNAIYHDVLSAVATTRDMALPIEQYRQLLDRSNEPDTYMGVALQVFALLAEIATIASQVSRVHKESASDKISRLIRLHAESNAVLERLNYVEPPGSCYVPDKMHLVFAFHAYRSAAELFMRQTVLRAAPTDIRTQVLVERTLLHLNLVLDTASESQMLLPLFVVGVDTVGVKPRAEVVELFNRFNARVLTGNIKTVHSLLQEVWKRNPDGDKWVDWRQIADDVSLISPPPRNLVTATDRTGGSSCIVWLEWRMHDRLGYPRLTIHHVTSTSSTFTEYGREKINLHSDSSGNLVLGAKKQLRCPEHEWALSTSRSYLLLGLMAVYSLSLHVVPLLPCMGGTLLSASGGYLSTD